MVRIGRRRTLSAFGALLTATLAGCTTRLTVDDDSGDETATSDRVGGGAPPPWKYPNSDADIVVENLRDGPISVSLDVGGAERRFDVEEGGYWVSGDVVPPGEDVQVTLSVDSGIEAERPWPAEEANEQVLVFGVREHCIDVSLDEKAENTDWEGSGPASSATAEAADDEATTAPPTPTDAASQTDTESGTRSPAGSDAECGDDGPPGTTAEP